MSGKKRILFKSEERRSLGSVAKFLRELADRIEENEVVLLRGGDEVKVELPPEVELEVEVEEKRKKRRTKRSLELEIEWYEGESSGRVTLG
jgi:amphi-Trp domain-containing protein